MKEKMMDPKSIDYYIIDCAIPTKISIEYCYQINFGNNCIKFVIVRLLAK